MIAASALSPGDPSLAIAGELALLSCPLACLPGVRARASARAGTATPTASPTTTESENRVGIRADRGIWRFYHATNDGQNSRDGMDRASTHVRENFAGSGPLADEPTSIMMGREVPPTNHQGSTGLAARAQAVVSNLDD